MAMTGGGGMLWLTAPRDAYMGFRSGVGFLWAAANWSLIISMIFFLWSDSLKIKKLVLICVVYSVLLYFLGSKAAVVCVWVAGFTVYHFRVRPIPVVPLLMAACLAPFLFFGLLSAHGSADSFEFPALYFRDYVNTTAMALDIPGLFDGHGMGHGWLTSLWAYVPRALDQDKPYEYGILLIHREIFPGAAEAGHTPGIAEWALAYYDFGVVGVMAYGYLLGVIQRNAFLFLKENRSIPALVAYFQFAFCGVLLYAFPLISMIICFCISRLMTLGAEQSSALQECITLQENRRWGGRAARR